MNIMLGALMKELKLSDSCLDERVRLQRTVYLLQIMGLSFGYEFKWFVRGMYSPELARDIKKLETTLQKSRNEFEFTALQRKLLNNFFSYARKEFWLNTDCVEFAALMVADALNHTKEEGKR